jgi:hypothetical protein
VRVPKGGSVGIVCSNRRFVRLPGPAAWSLTETACAKGKELTPAEYALIAPQGGRFKVVEGLLVLEREIRSGNGNDPLAPLVLSPRNTVLRSPRPTLSWSRVPATEYLVHWIGRGAGDHDLRLEAGKVACSQVLQTISVCSLPWPEDRPDLPPGKTFSLKIAARSGLAEKGLYADAADFYRQALAAAPTSELRITLADLDFVMGLHFLAEPRYREVLPDNAPSVRAAAAFGLGRIAYTRGKYREAAASFWQARELYSQLRLGEEEAAARQAAEKAAARVPK